MVNHARRDVLKLCGAAVSPGVVTGLSGCIGSYLGGGSAGLDYSYLIAPGEVADRDHYGFGYLEPSTLKERNDAFDESVYEQLASFEEAYLFPTGLEFGDVNAMLLAGAPVKVLSASYETAELEAALADYDYEEADAIEGFTVYEHVESAVGFSDGIVVLASSTDEEEDPVDVLETVLEAANTTDQQYRNDSGAMGALLDAIGDGHVVRGTTQEPPSSIGVDPDTEGTPIAYGETVEGQLERRDAESARYKGYHDRYVFGGFEGDDIVVTMTADGDPSLTLLGPDGQPITTAHSGGDDLNAELRHTLAESGTYTIVAASFSPEEQFEYELSLDRGSTIAWSRGGFSSIENVVAHGSKLQVDGDSSRRTWAVVFDEEAVAETDPVQAVVDENVDGRLGNLEDLSVNKSGRVVTVAGTIDTDEIRRPWGQ